MCEDTKGGSRYGPCHYLHNRVGVIYYLTTILDKIALDRPLISKSYRLATSVFNPYSPNVTFLYPLKTSENLRFSDVFRGYRKVTLGEYELSNERQSAYVSSSTKLFALY